MRPFGSLSAAFTACCLASRLALGAGSPAATLEVSRADGAESCIDAARLTKSVEARLRRTVFARSGSAPLALAVDLVRREQAWVATVRISDELGALGQRELSTEAPHCSALDDSLSLVVALLVDTPPARLPAETPQPGAPPVTPDKQKAEPAKPATPLVLPPDTVAPREPLRFSALATGTAALGLLPGLAPGVGLAAALSIPRGPRIRLGGELYFEREARLEDGGGAKLSALRAGLELCGLSFGSRSLAFEICGGQHIGQLAVDGMDFDQNLEQRRLIVSLDAGPDLRLPLTQDFNLVVAARAEVPLTRDRFLARLADGTSALIYQQAPVGLVMKVGVEVAP